jgi:hypothetical protein
MMEYYAAPKLAYGPLVFLNMCESAQVLPSLSGGFIPFFLQRGARCIIGTECPMTATFADPFARIFFRRFLQGQPVGNILWNLRQEYMKEGNPLGLAYTLYGDASTKLDKAIIDFQIVEKEATMASGTIEQQVDRLWLKPEEDLYVTLGINQQAVETAQEENDATKLAKAQQYDTVFSAQDTQMGVLDDLKEFGKRWWVALEPKLHELLCNKKNPEHDKLMKALADGAKMLAVALAPSLVAPGVVPAVAVVVATIAAKKIYESGMEVVCQMWKESLDEKAQNG